jgi:hypothetical protein
MRLWRLRRQQHIRFTELMVFPLEGGAYSTAKQDAATGYVPCFNSVMSAPLK